MSETNVIGNKNIIEFMIDNTDIKKRNTGLKYKLSVRTRVIKFHFEKMKFLPPSQRLAKCCILHKKLI